MNKATKVYWTLKILVDECSDIPKKWPDKKREEFILDEIHKAQKLIEDAYIEEAKNVDLVTKRVLCAACGKPIHIDDFGGLVRGEDNRDLLYHDNITCLIQLHDRMKELEKEKEDNNGPEKN